jgi:DNA-binding NtrC family response regulator
LKSASKKSAVFILVLDKQTAGQLCDLCRKNRYHPVVTDNPDELRENLRDHDSAIIFFDHETINRYGPGIYSRVRVACPGGNVILLCDKSHRDLIREAMELGVYACILVPYRDWEVLTIIKNILARNRLKRRKKPPNDQAAAKRSPGKSGRSFD